MSLLVSRATSSAGQEISFGKLTVLVGPNNSGKSQTLRDLRAYLTSGQAGKMKALRTVEVNLPALDAALARVRWIPELNNPPQGSYVGVGEDLRSGANVGTQDTWLATQYGLLPGSAATILEMFGKYWVAHLDAKSRFELTAQTPAYDLRSEAPGNAIHKLFESRSTTQDQLRTAFKEAFDMDIGLDWAAMKNWYLRVSSDFGEIPDTSEALNALMATAEPLELQGDGYKSFAGIALAVLTFPDRLLLLDEPEAFLHPAQARVLGRWLALQAAQRPGQIVVASHSSDFLWGVLSANTSPTVLRLNRTSAATSYHVIEAATTTGLVQSPLLSSQPVLDALFYKGVVVCEGDPDRAVYQTVAHKMLDELGGSEILFIHTNGKGAAKTPLTLLCGAGAPACAIVDIDVINSDEPLASIVESLTTSPPDAEIARRRAQLATVVEATSPPDLLATLVASVKAWLDEEHTDLRSSRKGLIAASEKGMSKWDAVKKQGVAFFQDADRTTADELLARMAQIGVFVVPCGELEKWFPFMTKKGAKWNREALEALHDDKCPAELKAFMTRVVEYLVPPALPTHSATAATAVESAPAAEAELTRNSEPDVKI